MEGSLEKLATKLGLNYYQKRHYRIEWSQLKYYAKADEDDAKGSIELAELHGAYLSDDDIQRKTIVLLFGNRSLFLVAPDPEEAKAWVHNLRCFSKRSSPSDSIPIPKHIVRSIIALIASVLANGGSRQEGLFRVPGHASRIKSICRSVYLNRSTVLTMQEARDVESTAGSIKRLLWCLPEPLFTHTRVLSMTKATSAAAVRELILEMPLDNQVVINNLFGLLSEVCANQSETKMKPLSLAMCFSPCLSGAESGAILDMKPLFTIIMDNYDEIFAGIASSLESAPTADGSSDSIVECLSKTGSAQAIAALVAENGGDLQKTLKRTSRQLWDTIRPRVPSTIKVPPKSPPSRQSIGIILNEGVDQDRDKTPVSISMTPKTLLASGPSLHQRLNLGSMNMSLNAVDNGSIISPMASLKMTMVDQADSAEEEIISPQINRQLVLLRNRIHELEIRCAYWRKKAETAQEELSVAANVNATAQPDAIGNRIVSPINVSHRIHRELSSAPSTPANKPYSRTIVTGHIGTTSMSDPDRAPPSSIVNQRASWAYSPPIPETLTSINFRSSSRVPATPVTNKVQETNLPSNSVEAAPVETVDLQPTIWPVGLSGDDEPDTDDDISKYESAVADMKSEMESEISELSEDDTVISTVSIEITNDAIAL